MHHHESIRIGLPEKIFGFKYFIVRIDSYQRCAYLCGREHKEYPFGIIRRPDRDVAAFSDAYGKKSSRHSVTVFFKSFVCHMKRSVEISDAVIVGKQQGNTVQQIAQRHIDQCVVLFSEDRIHTYHSFSRRLSCGKKNRPNHFLTETNHRSAVPLNLTASGCPLDHILTSV